MKPTAHLRYQATGIINTHVDKPEPCHSYSERMAVGRRLCRLFDEYTAGKRIFTRDQAELIRGSIIPEVLSMGDIVFIRLRNQLEENAMKALFTFL